MGVVSFGSECPSHGVYGRVTEVKHWIQFLAQGAEDSNCNKDIPVQQGNMLNVNVLINYLLYILRTPHIWRQQ